MQGKWKKISKQNINILFLLLILSLCGPLTLQIYPLKWKEKCKTAPFQLSFPRAILGSLFQTTSEKDLVFSCSPCLYWLREGSLGLLGMASQGRSPLLPAPSAAAAGPRSRFRGMVGTESTLLYLCWERVVVDLFAGLLPPRFFRAVGPGD